MNNRAGRWLCRGAILLAVLVAVTALLVAALQTAPARGLLMSAIVRAIDEPGERSAVLVDPSDEKLKSEFADVKRTFGGLTSLELGCELLLIGHPCTLRSVYSSYPEI